MSLAACRCCGLFTHPTRLRLLHTSTGATRAFATTRLAADEVKKLPSRNWGALKPTAPPARNWGALSGDADSGRSGDRGRDGERRRDDTPGHGGQGHRQPRGGHRGGHHRGGEDRGKGHRPGHREPSRGPKQPAQGFGMRNAQAEDAQTAAMLPRRQWSARGGPAAQADQLAKGETVPEKVPEVEVASQGEGLGAVSEQVVEEDNDSEIGSSRHGSRSRRRALETDRAKLERDAEGVAFNRGPKRTPSTLQEQRYIDAMNEKQEREARRKQKERERQRMAQREEQKVMIPSNVTVARLATIFGRKIAHVQSRMQRVGLRDEKQRADYILNAEEACDIALEFGFNPTVDDEAAFDLLPEPEVAGQTADLRPPVVTIMGHVDHGKTTLLDALRNTAVAAGEAGGITQHIGAFSVPLKLLQPGTKSDATITFLDTPGHAAFTAMRARGASVTDIVVLVVAADDGVMPQTKEVLELVKSEGDKVGLVVAINKVDKPEIDFNRVKNELLQEGVHLEEDGGDVQSVQVSGLARLGLDNLVETLSTLAELRDLRARSGGKAEGYVLESNVDRGIGRVATVLVTRGTLKVGSVVVAGNTSCKVRRMTDHTGKTIKSAGPGTPVVITGWKEIPAAGDELLEAPNGEREAAKVVANRIALADRQKLLADTEVINVKRQEDRAKMEAEHEAEKAVKQSGGNVTEARLAASKRAAAEARENTFKELRIVIKGDVSGTVEAVEGALSGIGNKEAGVRVVHTGVGEVTDSDVAMAEASGAMVIGFNVPCAKSIRTSATQKHVDLHLESVIYRLIETVRKKTAALLPPTIESRTIGEGTVGEVFTIKLPKRQTQTVAGARCTNGTFSIHDKIRILRGAKRDVVFEGPIKTLKHLKRDVDEIRKGMECGIAFEGFDDVLAGDEVVTFKTFEVAREL